MNHTLTTTLSENIFKFLNEESSSKNVTKKSIIEKGIEHYRKIELEKQVKKGFDARKSEYSKLNNELRDVQFSSLKD